MNITTIQHLFKSKSAKLRVVLAVVAALFFLTPNLALAQNTPPVADAGEDQTMFENEEARLAGSATDANGNPILNWQWTMKSSPEGSSWSISPPNYPVAYFTADLAGDYLLSLSAYDGLDWSLPDYLTIHVI